MQSCLPVVPTSTPPPRPVALSAPLTRKLCVHEGAAVHYRTTILNADGSIAKRRDWKKNLILDQGFNQIATNVIAACAANCAVGTGSPVLRRDSGAINLSRSGTTVTASAGFFVSLDVGRVIKFNSGEEMHVTAFTDSTHVTVDISGTISSGPGTVWYVNNTGLISESKRTSTLASDVGANGTSFSVDTISYQRTFIFSAETGAVTYHEIGWSPVSSAGANLFGMDIIPGVGDSLVTGQQYKVEVVLSLKLSPIAPTAVADFGNNGYVTAGNFTFEGLDIGSNDSSFGVLRSDNSGLIDGGSTMEPSATGMGKLQIATSTWTQGGVIAGPASTPGAVAPSSYVRGSYTSGSFSRQATSQWDVSTANGTHYGIYVNAFASRCMSLKYTNPQTKDSSHVLTIIFQISWGRILTN